MARLMLSTRSCRTTDAAATRHIFRALLRCGAGRPAVCTRTFGYATAMSTSSVARLLIVLPSWRHFRQNYPNLGVNLVLKRERTEAVYGGHERTLAAAPKSKALSRAPARFKSRIRYQFRRFASLCFSFDPIDSVGEGEMKSTIKWLSLRTTGCALLMNFEYLDFEW